MKRSAVFVFSAYLWHWLVKEDRHSQQSPFIFNLYQGALDLLKKENPATKSEKITLLVSFFCQLTTAKQVLELGDHEGIGSKFLDHEIHGKLYRIQKPESLVEGINAVFQQIQTEFSLDFVLIHPQRKQTYLQEALTLCMERMHGNGILFLIGIHHYREMNANWKSLQGDTRIQLTLDFFDFGVVFLSYSGRKTNLSLSY